MPDLDTLSAHQHNGRLEAAYLATARRLRGTDSHWLALSAMTRSDLGLHNAAVEVAGRAVACVAADWTLYATVAFA